MTQVNLLAVLTLSLVAGVGLRFGWELAEAMGRAFGWLMASVAALFLVWREKRRGVFSGTLWDGYRQLMAMAKTSKP